MKLVGFCDRWTNIVMKCVRYVSYSVVLNGYQGQEFKPNRGIGQGDPLSPYVFIICVESFSRLLNKAKQDRRISRAKVGRGDLSITHLFFADDNMLFGEASLDGVNNMKATIKMYEELSRQLVNFDKSLIYFSTGLSDELKSQLGGVCIANNSEKYLGLSTMVG